MHNSCSHALRSWVTLCEFRVQIIDHAILTAATPKAKEKLFNERNKIQISSHHARFRLERLIRLERGNTHSEKAFHEITNQSPYLSK